MHTRLIILIAFLAMALPAPLFAATHYVDRDAIGADDGTTWKDAFPILQDALAVASSGDEIWVAWGIYYPDEGTAQTDNDRNSTFTIPNGVPIFGGFAGFESLLSERNFYFYKSILSGDLRQDDDDADGNGIAESVDDLNGSNAYHVVTGLAAPAGGLLDGFTITAGQASASGGGNAGGMLISVDAHSINNCHFTGNFADDSGGAIHANGSDSAFVGCLFSGNVSKQSGGAVASTNGSRLKIINSAFVGNSAKLGGGAFFEGEAQGLINCSFSGNDAALGGGAFHATGGTAVVRLVNTLIWNNSVGGKTDFPESSFELASGALVAADFSLVENITFPGGAGNLDGTLASNDPLFFVPPDPTAAPSSAGDLRLRLGSPLTDIGSNASISEPRDLGGQLRIIDSQPGGGAVVEFGAYEIARPIYVDSGTGGLQNGQSWATALRTIQDALSIAAPGNEIRVGAGTYYPDEGAGQTNNDEASTFQLLDDVALLGGYQAGGSPIPDPGSFITILSGDIDQNDIYSGAVVRSPVNINGTNTDSIVTGTGTNRSAILDGFIINAGKDIDSGGRGAGISVGAGSPSLTKCTFIACHAVSGGAVVLLSGGHATFTSCSFSKNATTIGTGGAVNSRAGAAPGFIACSFNDNEALSAGAVFLNSNTSNDQFQAMFLNCSFTNNTANRAGAIYNASSNWPSIRGCTFIGNSAVTGDGGAIYGSAASSAVIADCTFTDNSAGKDGGAIYSSASRPSVTDCVFTNNTAGDRAGALMNKSFSSSVITRCQFIGNSSGEEGGATYMNDISDPIFTDCLFRANHSDERGGAAFCAGGTVPEFTRCQFVDNSAVDDGGAIKNSVATPTFINCTFTGNRSDADGGGVHLTGFAGIVSPEFTNCLFSGNLAQNGGALANIGSSEPRIVNCTMTGNAAVFGGGAIYADDSILDFANCMLWNNRAAGQTTNLAATVTYVGTGTSEFTNCLVANSGGSASWDVTIGTDQGLNIDQLPVFVVPVDLTTVPTSAGDLRLVTGSPGIDDGRNSANSEPLDLAGNPRIVDGSIDIGAYEGGITLTDSDGDSLPSQWEKSYSTNGSSTSISPGDDLDNDGLSAWFEFLHGLDPNIPNLPADATLVSTWTDLSGFEYLSISFPRNPASIGFLTSKAERSTSLGPSSWSVFGMTLPMVEGNIVTYRSKIPMPQAREFLRVTVE